MTKKSSFIKKDQARFLSPVHETLQIDGKLTYKEGTQSWSVIQLRKEILQEFPQLKEKRSSFLYKMILPRTFKDIKEIVKECEDNQKGIPLLLFFSKEKIQENH